MEKQVHEYEKANAEKAKKFDTATKLAARWNEIVKDKNDKLQTLQMREQEVQWAVRSECFSSVSRV